MFQNINMKRVNKTKNSRAHQEPGDVFEYCFLPDDGKKTIKHSGDVFRKYKSAKVSALGNTNPGGTLVYTSR